MRHLISLGVRCDVAFQLRAHSGSNVAHFFDWLVTPVDALVAAFERDFDIFRPENLLLEHGHGHQYIRDAVSGIVFHHQFPTIGADTTSDYLLFYSSFAGKFGHLAARFRDYASNRPCTLVRRRIDHADAIRLEEAFFQRFPGSDTQFLYVNEQEGQFQTAFGKSVFLPASNRGLGDPHEWACLLEREALIGTPYRLASEEILGQDHDDHALPGADRFTTEELIRALSHNDTNISLRIELALSYERDSRFKDAADLLLAACASAHPDEAIERAYASWKAGYRSLEEALRGLDEQGTSSKASSLAKQKHVDMLMSLHLYDDALHQCTSAITANPLMHTLYYRKATCLFKLARLQEAERAIDLALKLCATRPMYFHLRAGILVKLQRLSEAIVAQGTAVQLRGGFQSALAYARMLQRAGRAHDAAEAFRQAQDYRPELSSEIELMIKACGLPEVH